ncbi:hypothetical protein ACH0B6_16955 [Solibacillus silvestris]
MNIEGDSNRLVWTVIGLGMAAMIGTAAYMYFSDNVPTWLQQIGSVMTNITS